MQYDEADAAAIHRRATVIDAHVDILLPTTAKRFFMPDGGSRAELWRLIEGGVDAVVLSLAAIPYPRTEAGTRAARKEVEDKLAWVGELVAANADKVAIALRADDVERLDSEGRVAIILGFLNALAWGTDLGRIEWLHEQGVRIFGMNHAGHNDWSDSSRPFFGDDKTLHGGLSAIGKQAVPRLNDLGMLIDVSQQSREAALQTIELSRMPVIASHSAVRGLVNNARNISDEEADAIKAKGGVVHVPPFSAYLVAPTQEFFDQVRLIRLEYGLPPEWTVIYDDTQRLPEAEQTAYAERFMALLRPATLGDYIDHIDYLVQRIGWQHVGIGTDFNQGGGVEGFNSADEAPNVTAALLERGYSEEQISAIWGQNLLRVMRVVEAGALE